MMPPQTSHHPFLPKWPVMTHAYLLYETYVIWGQANPATSEFIWPEGDLSNSRMPTTSCRARHYRVSMSWLQPIKCRSSEELSSLFGERPIMVTCTKTTDVARSAAIGAKSGSRTNRLFGCPGGTQPISSMPPCCASHVPAIRV